MVSFGKLRFRFEDDEEDPEEEPLIEQLDRQLAKVTTADDKEEDNEEENMDALLTPLPGEPTSLPHSESIKLLGDS